MRLCGTRRACERYVQAPARRPKVRRWTLYISVTEDASKPHRRFNFMQHNEPRFLATLNNNSHITLFLISRYLNFRTRRRERPLASTAATDSSSARPFGRQRPEKALPSFFPTFLFGSPLGDRHSAKLFGGACSQTPLYIGFHLSNPVQHSIPKNHK